MHAASVGEAQSALVLIDRLLKDYPKLQILVTTGTVTSAIYLENRLPIRSFHQYLPPGLSILGESHLTHWAPDIAFWLESELWPNLVSETMRRDIPAILVNA